MSDGNDEWDLAPENAHPKARAALTEPFFWDCVDDNSPFGNDNGADTLALFREWRQEHPRANPLQFLDQLLESWDMADEHWEALDPAEVGQIIQLDRFSLLTRDESIIALAFGQIVLEGRVDPEVKARALLALERQALPPVLGLWRDEYQAERKDRLRLMESILQQDWN